MSDAIVFIGILIAIYGGILFLIATFRESIIWGIACIIISPISIVFALLHWNVSKRPVLIQLSGFAVIFLGAMIAGKL